MIQNAVRARGGGHGHKPAIAVSSACVHKVSVCAGPLESCLHHVSAHVNHVLSNFLTNQISGLKNISNRNPELKLRSSLV